MNSVNKNKYDGASVENGAEEKKKRILSFMMTHQFSPRWPSGREPSMRTISWGRLKSFFSIALRVGTTDAEDLRLSL